jgi:hypothetical protein
MGGLPTMRLRFLTVVLLVAGSTTGHAASLTPDEAATHVGETARVCGTIASTKFAAQAPLHDVRGSSSDGTHPLDLLGRPYLNQMLSVIIFGSDRAKFGLPETSLREKSFA